MNLFLSDMNKSFEDLFKAGRTGGGPRTGSGGGARAGASSPVTSVPGPRTGSGGGPRTGAGMPSTPGAVSGGGKQVVDCPLGIKCPDGGKHQMGSQKLQMHTKQAQAGMQTGLTPGDESKGEPVDKPGVQPGSQNIGSLGSDQVKKPDSTKTQEMQLDPQEKQLRRNEQRAKPTKEMPALNLGDKTQEFSGVTEQSQAEQKQVSGTDKTQEMPARVPAPIGEQAKDRVVVGLDDVARTPEEHKKFIDQQAQAAVSAAKEHYESPSKPWHEEAAAGSPAAHYKLAQVAQDSGDSEGSQKQLDLARKKSENLSSEEHKQLADQLRQDGMHEHADYHEGIHSRVQDYKGEQAPPDHEKKMKTVQDSQSSKASQAMKDAEASHEKTKKKAKELAEKAKAEGKKPPASAKAPKKPELTKPSSEGEKLKHENHTARAKRTADMIESHLKNNPDLSPEDRRRLERAHKMAVFHQNVEFTPTAQHKQELGEVERTAKDLGIKEHWDDIQAKEDAKHTAQAKKEVDKEEATKAKAAAANQKPAPKLPEAPIEHARVADHKGRAKKLREKLQSHKDGNPNMSEEDHAVADQIMAELDEHESMEHVPDSDMDAKLKELHKLAGDMGKKPYEPEEAGEDAPADSGGLSPRRDAAGYLMAQFHSGRAAGAGLAASATSPYGAAGHVAPQIIGYGAHGITSAGHRLLQRTEDGMRAQDKLDQEKDKQAKESEKYEKQAKKANNPDNRGLAGGT